MRTRVTRLWRDTRDSLWFVPAVMIAAALAASVLIIQADDMLGDRWARYWPRLLMSDAEGSRQMLSAIATAIMTVVGVSFSVILVALSLASTQYTTRVLGNFMRDRSNQVVLGFLAGTYAYCLVVLKTVHLPTSGRGGVPDLAVAVGILLGIGAVAVFAYFIHHISVSIQASTILKSIFEETNVTIEDLYSSAAPDGALKDQPPRSGAPVRAHTTGYIQIIDASELVRLARERGLRIAVRCRPGDFTVAGDTVAIMTGSDDPEADERAVAAALRISGHRTIEEDPLFGIRQIVDIALKALSPGINDSATAVTAVDYLIALLLSIAPRRLEIRREHEPGPHLVYFLGPEFQDILDEAFAEVIRNARRNVLLLARIIDGLGRIAAATQDRERHKAIRGELRLISETARIVDLPADREMLEARIAKIAGEGSNSAEDLSAA